MPQDHWPGTGSEMRAFLSMIERSPFLLLVARTVIITAFYAGSGYLGLWSAQQRDLWPTLWFPSAVSLTAVVFWGPSAAIGVGFGVLLMRITSHASTTLIITTFLANTVEAYVGGLVLGRRFNLRSRRLTPGEIPGLVFTLVLITNISALIGVFSQKLSGIWIDDNLLRAWWSWWSGNAAAVILIAPIWLWGRESDPGDDARAYHQRILLVLGISLGILLCMLPMPEGPTPIWRPTLAFVPQLLIYWSSLTLGARSVAFLGSIVGVVISLATNVGRGPFATLDPVASYEAATLFNIVTGTSTLWLSTLAAERNLASRNIANHQQELETTVRSRTLELEERTRELQAFSYAVSHDLRAPLRGISSWILALEEDCSTQLDAVGRRHLERIRAEANRMGKLIEGLLSLSHISASEINLRSVDISVLASTILSRLAETHPERVVQTRIAPGLVVDGDPVLCEIALTNLLENAWKFTARTSVAKIAVEPLGENEGSGFRVEDNGAGFDPSNRNRLFIPFQRFHRASDFPGTGIGLATVHRITKRHGGSVQVQSSPGEGTSITMIFPRDPTVCT
jgi:signal transduction histidine kinase